MRSIDRAYGLHQQPTTHIVRRTGTHRQCIPCALHIPEDKKEPRGTCLGICDGVPEVRREIGGESRVGCAATGTVSIRSYREMSREHSSRALCYQNSYSIWRSAVIALIRARMSSWDVSSGSTSISARASARAASTSFIFFSASMPMSESPDCRNP